MGTKTGKTGSINIEELVTIIIITWIYNGNK